MPIFKKKKITDKQAEEISKINNLWQLIAFVIIESPKIFFTIIFSAVLIFLIFTINFSVKIGTVLFTKSAFKITQKNLNKLPINAQFIISEK